MKEIGGYFELELPRMQHDFIHSGCVMVNSGRHALEYILRGLGSRVKRILIPYYTCDVVLHTIRKLNICYDFYHIDNDLELDSDLQLKDGEYIIVNNYFGIKDEYISRMASKYKSHLIIDNAQAWYAPEILGFNTFYSPRKFFGLPDGGCALATSVINKDLEKDCSYERCSHLLKRIDINASAGYDDFRKNSAILKDEPLKGMSDLTYRMLSSIDFEWAKTQRRANYDMLDSALCCSNLLKLPCTDSFACPMVYPYMTEDVELRHKLIANNVFVAQYWPNVFDWCDSDSLEFELAKKLIPLPIDQRYGAEDMKMIIDIINK